MTYAEYIRQEQTMDKYILLLLSLELPLEGKKKQLGVYQVADLLSVSHQTVYNCLERNPELVKEYINGF